MRFRVGQGIDLHRFAFGRKLILCGVEIPCEVGLDGHSDADVATHALMDALLGALALPDIGQLFPNTDLRYKGANSIELLKLVDKMIKDRGFRVENIDLTILAEKPKIAPFKAQMQTTLAQALEIDPTQIGIKATTCEQLGSIGRGEGMVASAVVLVSGS